MNKRRVCGNGFRRSSSGVSEIIGVTVGEVVLDDADYQIDPTDPAAFDAAPLRPYHAQPAALLPANLGSVMADPACRCEDGRISYGNAELAQRLGLPALDVSAAGCGRE